VDTAATDATIEPRGTPASHRLLIMNCPPPERNVRASTKLWSGPMPAFAASTPHGSPTATYDTMTGHAAERTSLLMRTSPWLRVWL
jgi:hypothetical protein